MKLSKAELRPTKLIFIPNSFSVHEGMVLYEVLPHCPHEARALEEVLPHFLHVKLSTAELT